MSRRRHPSRPLAALTAAVLGLVGAVAVAAPASGTSGGSTTAAAQAADGVVLSPAEATAGTVLTLDYPVPAGMHAVSAQAALVNRYLPSERFSLTEVHDPVSGRLTFTVPAGAATGHYDLTSLVLTDADGTPTTRTFSEGSVTTHVTGTQRDAEPPALSALALQKGAAWADQASTYSYATTETARLQRITVAVTSDTWEGGTVADALEDAPVSGSVAAPASGTAGTNRLAVVVLVDGAGNTTEYHRDGSLVLSVPGGRWVKTRHSLDLAALDVTVAPAAPSATARAVPRGARVTIGVGPSEAEGIDGFRVTVNPGGIVRTIPVGTVPDGGAVRTLAVSGLPNGVTHTVSIVATSQFGTGRATTSTVVPLLSTNVFSPGDTTGDGRPDVRALLREGAADGVTRPVYTYPGNGTGGFRARTSDLYEARAMFDRVAPAGPRYASGTSALLALESSGSAMMRVEPNANIGLGSGWRSMRFIDGGSDFTGDGIADVLAVAPTGELYRYTVSSNGTITRRTQIGSGWQQFVAVFSPGDFSGDRKADVLAVSPDGRLWLYRGNGTGGWVGARQQVGSGWAGFGGVLPLRDFDGDGRVDVGAVTMSGDLLLYPGNGRAGWLGGARKIGAGWHVFF